MPNTSDIITTVGGSASTSYVTLAEFANYRDQNRINADAFDAATVDNKIRALMMAARRLNRENWRGSKVDGTQALAWPRYEVPKKDSALTGTANQRLNDFSMGFWGEYYESTEIPDVVKDAQCELAIAYLEGFETNEGQRISKFQADGVSIEYSPSAKDAGLPVAVSQLISGLCNSGRLVRG